MRFPWGPRLVWLTLVPIKTFENNARQRRKNSEKLKWIVESTASGICLNKTNHNANS
jgi:hypothetical protein